AGSTAPLSSASHWSPLIGRFPLGPIVQSEINTALTRPHGSARADLICQSSAKRIAETYLGTGRANAIRLPCDVSPARAYRSVALRPSRYKLQRLTRQVRYLNSRVCPSFSSCSSVFPSQSFAP